MNLRSRLLQKISRHLLQPRMFLAGIPLRGRERELPLTDVDQPEVGFRSTQVARQNHRLLRTFTLNFLRFSGCSSNPTENASGARRMPSNRPPRADLCFPPDNWGMAARMLRATP